MGGTASQSSRFFKKPKIKILPCKRQLIRSFETQHGPATCLQTGAGCKPSTCQLVPLGIGFQLKVRHLQDQLAVLRQSQSLPLENELTSRGVHRTKQVSQGNYGSGYLLKHVFSTYTYLEV